MIYKIGVVFVKKVNGVVVVVKMNIFVMVKCFVLYLLKIVFVIGIIVFMIKVFGNNIKLEWNVDFLWMFWIYNGMIIFVFIIVIFVILVKIVVIVNVDDLNIWSFKNGCFKCNWCYENKVMKIILMIKKLIIFKFF